MMRNPFPTARSLWLATVLAIVSFPASAGPSCSPSDTTARILSAASPNAIHPAWRGDNRIGLGWSLQVTRSVRDASGTSYYVGDLYSPRGSVTQRGVYAIEDEWDCGP